MVNKWDDTRFHIPVLYILGWLLPRNTSFIAFGQCQIILWISHINDPILCLQFESWINHNEKNQIHYPYFRKIVPSFAEIWCSRTNLIVYNHLELSHQTIGSNIFFFWDVDYLQHIMRRCIFFMMLVSRSAVHVITYLCVHEYFI